MGFQNQTPEQRAANLAKSLETRRGARKAVRAERRQRQVVELRDQGISIAEIAKQLNMKVGDVNKILFNGVIKAERIQRFNEALISRNAAGLRVIDAFLEKNDKDVAMWLLEKTGAVGKEQVNLTINANNAQVNVGNDVVDAARQVAELMRRAVPVLPVANVVEGEIVVNGEENSNEHGQVAMGVIVTDDGSSGTKD